MTARAASVFAMSTLMSRSLWVRPLPLGSFSFAKPAYNEIILDFTYFP